MEKSCHSSGDGDSTVTSSTSTKSRNSSTSSDIYLKHLNKLSHKISKSNNTQQHQTSSQSQSLNIDNNPQMAAPPPVYTINKNDFREVVQRLTGSPVSSPAREQFSSPPPRLKSKGSSSRLQKIRPPPLAQICNRPPNVINCALGDGNNFGSMASRGLGLSGQRQPLSPLPPFPTVQASAESPVSAYMRFLHNSFCFTNVHPVPPQSNSLGSPRWNNVVPLRLNNLGSPRWNSVAAQRNNLGSPRWNNLGLPRNNLGSPRWNNAVPTRSNLASPRWNNAVPLRNNLDPSNNVVPHQWNKEGPPEEQMPPPPSPPPHQQQNIPPPQAFPLSPLPFGCSLASPGMFSPSLLFSPTDQLGFPQLPLSPTLPIPSPRWIGR